MTQRPESLLERLSELLGGGSTPADAERILEGVRDLVRERDRLLAAAERHRDTIHRIVDVVHADGLEPVAERVLDILLHLTRAERGFVAICGYGEDLDESEDGWRFIAARALSRTDLDDPESLVSTTIIREALESGEAIVTTDAMSSDFSDASSVESLRLRSVACLPIVPEGGRIGFVYLDNRYETDLFDETAMSVVSAFLPVAAEAIYAALARDDSGVPGFPDVVTCSEAFKASLAILQRAASDDVPVLLCGPTGTGKTLLARQVHEASPRAARSFVHVNSGAIPEALVEAELFGVTQGAFTGADRSRAGLFEAADGGTLYLDELQSLPVSCQVKLLVALEQGAVTRVGSTTPIPVDVRVVASLDVEPERAITEGRLREDLYYRLAVIVTRVPSLSERSEDVPLLAQDFLRATRRRAGAGQLRLGPRALAQLLQHDWPGNVRELQNVIERAALLASGEVISELQLEERSGWTKRLLGRRARVDLEEFQQAWDECGGHVGAVAERLGVHPKSVPRIRRRLQGK